MMAVVFCLSLLASLISFFGNRFKNSLGMKLSVVISWIAALLSLKLLHSINLSDLCNTYTFFPVLNFANIYGRIIQLGFRVDTLSAIWICTTTVLCAFTNLYSVGYMKTHARFMTYNNLFSASMILFVSANNFLQMYIGWELITLFSYLLINYYHYIKDEYKDTAFRIFILHKFGDIFFLIGILLLIVYFGSLELKSFYNFRIYGIKFHDILFALLLVPISVKSAQMGFMHWLKNAMIAPTPASAFLHAATIVSAGVYLFIRASSVLEISDTLRIYAGCYFMITAIVSAILAFREYDIKRILAYSTCSKMGILLTACCFGYYVTAVLLFVIHAFVKCTLFFCAGNISHALSNERDIRKMGNLLEDLPKTYSATIVSTLLFLGVIPAVIALSTHNVFFDTCLYIAEGLSVFYMIRMIYFVFHGESHLDEKSRGYLKENNGILAVSIVTIILANFAVRGAMFLIPGSVTPKENIMHYILHLGLVIACSIVYKMFKFDIAKYSLDLKMPTFDFSRGVQKLLNLQQFIENYLYSRLYTKIIHVGRRLTLLDETDEFCLTLGAILILSIAINLLYEAI